MEKYFVHPSSRILRTAGGSMSIFADNGAMLLLGREQKRDVDTTAEV
jgi:hypothetical protein